MQLTEKEEKIARLALDKGAKNGERQAAAIKLIESLYARGVRVEDLESTLPKIIYREVPVYRNTASAQPRGSVSVTTPPKKFGAKFCEELFGSWGYQPNKKTQSPEPKNSWEKRGSDWDHVFTPETPEPIDWDQIHATR